MLNEIQYHLYSTNKKNTVKIQTNENEETIKLGEMYDHELFEKCIKNKDHLNILKKFYGKFLVNNNTKVREKINYSKNITLSVKYSEKEEMINLNFNSKSSGIRFNSNTSNKFSKLKGFKKDKMQNNIFEIINDIISDPCDYKKIELEKNIISKHIPVMKLHSPPPSKKITIPVHKFELDEKFEKKEKVEEKILKEEQPYVKKDTTYSIFEKEIKNNNEDLISKIEFSEKQTPKEKNKKITYNPFVKLIKKYDYVLPEVKVKKKIKILETVESKKEFSLIDNKLENNNDSKSEKVSQEQYYLTQILTKVYYSLSNKD